MIFDISLYTTLQIEIGLKSMKGVGIETFEIKVMKVEFIAPMIAQEDLDSSTIRSKSYATMSKK